MSNLPNLSNRKIVLVGGCFDFIHFGHIHFLSGAKRYGNYLFVALESDENVRRRKGDSRPIHSQLQRQQMLEALKIVDEVLPLPTMTEDAQYFELVKKIKPHIIAVTAGDPYLEHKRRQAETVGAEVIEISKLHTPSTTQLAKLLGLE